MGSDSEQEIDFFFLEKKKSGEDKTLFHDSLNL